MTLRHTAILPAKPTTLVQQPTPRKPERTTRAKFRQAQVFRGYAHVRDGSRAGGLVEDPRGEVEPQERRVGGQPGHAEPLREVGEVRAVFEPEPRRDQE